MKRKWGRLAGSGLGVVAGSMTLVMLLGSPAAAASPVVCGAARGLTSSNAIQGAIDDAQVTAQSLGFYGTCTLTADPQVFESFNDPYFGHIFHAQVTATCAA
jgi:hypothetical protein